MNATREGDNVNTPEACYNEMFIEQAYEKAYYEIKSKPGNMTKGADNSTLDGFSKKKINNIIQRLKTREFQFKPSRRVFIPKANGKMRPLGIPSPDDKIVQNVYQGILERVYERDFLTSSHGFRPNRSCHTALMEVRK